MIGSDQDISYKQKAGKLKLEVPANRQMKLPFRDTFKHKPCRTCRFPGQLY